MTEEEVMKVNPNLADLEALVKLPGVGEGLARRIIEGRPYAEQADLLQVSSLGEATLARLSPFLTFAEEMEYHRETEDPQMEEGMLEPGVLPSEDEIAEKVDAPAEIEEIVEPEVRVQPLRVAKKRRRAERSPLFDIREPIWLVLGTTVIAVILSILLTLAVLGGINRTLDVGKHDAVLQLESEITDLRVEVQDMTSRMEALGRRMEAVEGLSGRVQTVEDEFNILQDQVSRSLEDMSAVQVLVEELDSEVEKLTESYGRFDAFLEGLYQLLLTSIPGAQPETPEQP